MKTYNNLWEQFISMVNSCKNKEFNKAMEYSQIRIIVVY